MKERRKNGLEEKKGFFHLFLCFAGGDRFVDQATKNGSSGGVMPSGLCLVKK
jgi:hypothetical protein